jgi:hypothetical protein
MYTHTHKHNGTVEHTHVRAYIDICELLNYLKITTKQGSLAV